MLNIFIYVGAATVACTIGQAIFGTKPLFEVKTEVVEEPKEEVAE